jgi:hypothetical protein
MYFRIGESWFKLPYEYPRDCYPQDGDHAKLAFEPLADLEHRGPPAHTILQMHLTHACRIAVSG